MQKVNNAPRAPSPPIFVFYPLNSNTMMSKKAKYAFKALIELGKAHSKGLLLQTQDIANSQKIPKKFLEHILIELKNGGYANSKLGPGGGYYLRKKPADIPLSEIYRMFEGAIALLPCVSERFYEPCEDCVDEASCSLKFVFTEIRVVTLSQLANQSVQTLLDRESKLARKKKT